MKFLFFVFVPLLLQAQYTLSICTMFKNEAQWIVEWIEYHRVIGVEHFYLYDNETTDNTLEILKPYIRKGIVEVIPWANTPDHWDPRGPSQNFDCYQIKAFNDCIDRCKGKTKWLAILDIDEYLVPVYGKKSLLDLLKSPEERSTGSFQLRWQIFGTSHMWEIPPGKLLIESLTRRAVDGHPWHNLVKSIHRPEAILATYVHTAHVNHPNWAIKLLPAEAFRIHHYWTRDEKDFCKKRLGLNLESRPDFEELRARGYSYNIDFVRDFNEVEDTSILRFVPAVRKAVFPSSN